MSLLRLCTIRSSWIKLCNANLQILGETKIVRSFGKHYLHRNAINCVEENQNVNLGKGFCRPSAFQKRILVWVGTYKTRAEIPEQISMYKMDKAQNKARVKTFSYMIAITLLTTCFYTVYNFRKSREEGMSLSKIDEDWHMAVRKKYEEEQKKLVEIE